MASYKKPAVTKGNCDSIYYMTFLKKEFIT